MSIRKFRHAAGQNAFHFVWKPKYAKDPFKFLKLKVLCEEVLREVADKLIIPYSHYPFKKLSSLTENRIYLVKYANLALFFHLVDFDEVNNILMYRVYTAFSGECNCLNTQECRNDRCELKEQNKKYGYLYVYEGDDTYNPDWREGAEFQIEKFTEGLLEVSNRKLRVDVDILGEYKTDLVCWNRGDKTFIELERDGDLFLDKLPGSDFDVFRKIFVYEDAKTNIEILKLDCDKCSPFEQFKEGDVTKLFVDLECDNALMPMEHFQFLDAIKQNAASQLGFDSEDYDEIIVVYGRFGRLDPDGDENTIYGLCGPFGDNTISGYANLEFAENNLNHKGIVDCRELRRESKYFNVYTRKSEVKYSAPGWHSLVHEVLHRFHTKDVYDTGFVFGIKSDRSIALEVDPNADQSIMGNKERLCVDQNECTQEELDHIYLDKYNKRIMGIWDD